MATGFGVPDEIVQRLGVGGRSARRQGATRPQLRLQLDGRADLVLAPQRFRVAMAASSDDTDDAPRQPAGSMLWLSRNRLSGSYRRLISTSLARLGP